MGDSKPFNPEDLRPSVLEFAGKMEYTLRKHDDDKAGWRNDSIGTLIDRLYAEVGELKEAYENCQPQELAAESCDVANFCMMVHDRITNRSD